MEINCAICNKQVDRWEVTRNDKHMNIEVTAYCHGASETCEVDDKFIHDAGMALGQIKGVAFAIKTLKPPE
jgi:hypothetical protein